MQRVLVMGSSGSGKSTFARRLSAMTGIPTVSIDALFWKPGWIESGRDEFERRNPNRDESQASRRLTSDTQPG